MTSIELVPSCPYCGAVHQNIVCPRVKAIEYFADGTMKAIEYFADGTIRRVEFKTEADYRTMPMLLPPYEIT